MFIFVIFGLHKFDNYIQAFFFTERFDTKELADIDKSKSTNFYEAFKLNLEEEQ